MKNMKFQEIMKVFTSCDNDCNHENEEMLVENEF
jgi:hypothetical protein